MSVEEKKLRIFKFDNVRLPSLKYIDGEGHRTKDFAVIAYSHEDASKILTEQFKSELDQQILINKFWAKVARDNNLPEDPKGFYTSTISWKTEKHWYEWTKSSDYPKVCVPRLIILQVFDLIESIDVHLEQFRRALKYAGCREIVAEIAHGAIIS